MTTEGPPIDPRSGEAPTFREPWEAQAFAIVVKLFQVGGTL